MPDIKQKSLAGSKIQAIPKEKIEIGIDQSNSLPFNVLEAAEQSTLDIGALDNFTNVSQSREQIYQLIDTMAQDSSIAAVLETYVEDSCETNDRGETIWAESSDTVVSKYVSYLLDSLNVNKNINNWMTKLVKYGDLYLKLYHTSDYEKDGLFDTALDFIEDEEKKDKNVLTEAMNLNEEIQLNYHSKHDHYVHYVEAEPNPAEMFELTKFGKTMGFIKAPADILINPINGQRDHFNQWYKVKKKDVQIFQATDYVHAALDDNSSRSPEEVNIYTTDDDFDTDSNANSYTVRRGQSLFYNIFKVWRVLSLLESSVALNRLTKSSILRILEVECGDMSKEGIQETLRSIKQMVEQKTAVKTGESMSEYTNPGPVENTIYLATKGEIGKISTQEIGTDNADPKSLLDLDYYNNKLYGGLRVPKQFFAQTDDGAGFNGGQSLAIISSRYGKAVKRIQNTMAQAITDVINLFLIDKGLEAYVNKFTIRMQAPVTQEMIDRREQVNQDIGVVRDVMQIISEQVEDPVLRLKSLKILLSSSSQDADLVNLIEEQIKSIESGAEPAETPEDNETALPDIEMGGNEELPSLSPVDLDTEEEPAEETIIEPNENEEEGEELPSFQDLGVEDATNLADNG